MIALSAERMTTHELCERRRVWTEKYANLRVSLLRALYMALDAGLTTDADPEKAAEAQFLALARSPGLDIVGSDVFNVAVHYAKLAGILAVAARQRWPDPWKPINTVVTPRGITWHSALYDLGEGYLRRIALVDRWTDDRKIQERWGWRTLGEVCALNETILITAITIGPSHDRRRHSPWAHAHENARNKMIRFKRKHSTEAFGGHWQPLWRENSDIPTEQWLTKMREDGCMTDLVHTVEVPVPRNRDSYLAEMFRIAREMERQVVDFPPMRLAGCFRFSPCNFRHVCHGGTTPEAAGFVPRETIEMAVA